MPASMSLQSPVDACFCVTGLCSDIEAGVAGECGNNKESILAVGWSPSMKAGQLLLAVLHWWHQAAWGPQNMDTVRQLTPLSELPEPGRCAEDLTSSIISNSRSKG